MSRPPSPCVWVRDTKDAAAAKPTTRKTISERVVRRRRVVRASCSSVARGAEAWNAPLRWRWAENIEGESGAYAALQRRREQGGKYEAGTPHTLSEEVKVIPSLRRGGVDRPAGKGFVEQTREACGSRCGRARLSCSRKGSCRCRALETS